MKRPKTTQRAAKHPFNHAREALDNGDLLRAAESYATLASYLSGRVQALKAYLEKAADKFGLEARDSLPLFALLDGIAEDADELELVFARIFKREGGMDLLEDQEDRALGLERRRLIKTMSWPTTGKRRCANMGGAK